MFFDSRKHFLGIRKHPVSVTFSSESFIESKEQGSVTVLSVSVRILHHFQLNSWVLEDFFEKKVKQIKSSMYTVKTNPCFG